jgi:hypothetical protein
MDTSFLKIKIYRQLLACCLAGMLIGFASCSDERDDADYTESLAEAGTITFNVAGIEESGSESLTRAQMEPQMVRQDLGDGLTLVYTLSLDPVPVTRATTAMTTGKKYRVIVYDGTTYVTEGEFTVGTTGSISGLQNKTYKLVAISYNSTTAPSAVGSSATTLTVDPSKDLLHWQGSVTITSGSATIGTILFKHCFPLLTLKADVWLTGDNITAMSNATVTNGYEGVLTLLDTPVSASNPAKGTTATQTFTWTGLTAGDVVSSDQRPVFTYGETPVTATFNNLTVNTSAGVRSISPAISFTKAMLPGYQYTLTTLMEASKGDYYPYASAVGSPYEVTIPLGANGYNYKDKNGVSQHVDELTFLRYNLGADPRLTAKQQMAYPHTDRKNIRVHGGLWQWGRNDVKHSLRDSIPDAPDFFTTTKYPKDEDPTKFVYNISPSPYNWTAAHAQNSNLWGNGGKVGIDGGLKSQTDFSYSSGTDLLGNSSGVANNLKNPCPTGYRVPTQYEWALIVNDNGTTGTPDPSTSTLDLLNFTSTSAPKYSGTAENPQWFVPYINENIVWVRVRNGKPCLRNDWPSSSGEPGDGMHGYAIYAKSDITSDSDPTAAYNSAFAIGNDLTADAAPTPLTFFPAAGQRGCVSGDNGNGKVVAYGSNGQYWSTTIDGQAVYVMSFNNYYMAVNYSIARALGTSIRCIKNLSGTASDY